MAWPKRPTFTIFTFKSTGLVLLLVPATRGATVNSIYRQNGIQYVIPVDTCHCFTLCVPNKTKKVHTDTL